VNTIGSIDLPIPELTRICRKFHVAELSLFGSAARGDMREDSDIDFLVEFEADARIGFLALSALTRELSEVVHRPVDVAIKSGLKERIRGAVLAEAKLLYAA
jgi:predicted nucleotidyltransferase